MKNNILLLRQRGVLPLRVFSISIRVGGKSLWNLFSPFYPGKEEKGIKTMFLRSFSPDKGEKGGKNLISIYSNQIRLQYYIA